MSIEITPDGNAISRSFPADPMTELAERVEAAGGALDAAIRVMLDAHRGQVDKGGQPYFLHPLRVMLWCEGEADRIVAVLHDVIEDSAITTTDLRNLFGEEVATAVQAVTRCDSELYSDFIARCAANPIARRVKIADLNDNMDLTRLGRVPTAHDLRRHDKYADAAAALRARKD